MHLAHSEISIASGDIDLLAIVADAAHLLPAQAPLHVFVHHNPLHAFEHLPFERAVVEAAAVLGNEPYQSEAAFAECLEIGRIRATDVRAVVDADPSTRAGEPVAGLSRRDFVAGRLSTLFEVPRGAALEWHLQESPALSVIHPRVDTARRRHLLRQAQAHRCPSAVEDAQEALLAELWNCLDAVGPKADRPSLGRRPRDRILAATGLDPDEWVHPLLIRLCAAFLDQGIAYWSMPARDAGFLAAVRELYQRRGGPPDRWLSGLAAQFRLQRHEAWTAERTIRWALERMDVAERDWPPVIRDTLLSLRGWAGMIRQFELRPSQAPVAARPARLLDYLAVQLVLDSFAARHAIESGSALAPAAMSGAAPRDRALVYEAFVAAQILPVDLHLFRSPDEARAWVEAVRQLDSLERRRLLHLAYERRHRVEVLDGILANERLPGRIPSPPEFQAVFCIDEREESLRRHLEEIEPSVETFGYAGFFGVAMEYQGLDDIHPRPLCPVAVPPRHGIVERALEPRHESQYRSARRRQGTIRHAFGIGSKSLARGGILTAATGLISVVPLVARCLFPTMAERWARRLHRGTLHGPATRLVIEHNPSAPDVATEHGLPGYTVDEMTTVVRSAMQTVGLGNGCSPIVLIVGHGSSSLNNPHEAAHDCGATGGGRGGPNARAFAAMANHPEVRRALQRDGIAIPQDTWFVGAYHNTCDDSVTYYDEDLVPDAGRKRLAAAQTAMERACSLNAHERCRRFGATRRTVDADGATARVAERSVDLAQPRPEYGHATNAVCIVGRRSRTRGLYLDRRSFLVSYDPMNDPDGVVLSNLLLAVGPVGAGINLEYYFSFVDPTGYGCGTKLPHNISGLIGVMDGHASDLRTGLPWQMVEIHEPVRLLLVVEAEPLTLERVLRSQPALNRLVKNEWIQLVSWSPRSFAMHLFTGGGFEVYRPEVVGIRSFENSHQVYAGRADHVGPAHLTGAAVGAMA